MKIAFVASAVKEAQQAVHRLKQKYGDVTPEEADAIVVLGGDGLMLQTLIEKKPVSTFRKPAEIDRTEWSVERFSSLLEA